MTYDLVIRPEAEADISDAYRWYEDQREGLGTDFISCIEAALDSIIQSPRLYPKIHKDIRRVFIRHFPYGIFYLVKDNRIIVLAVFHARRDPQGWQTRND